MAATGDSSPLYERPAELLRNLLRFDTTNPPGNEEACVLYIRDLLAEAGISGTLLARTPGRPNLVARLAGRGHAPPLLLYGHVDVVPAEAKEWQYPPFAGEIVDGWLWGRGALDMKSAVAMMVSAMLRAQAEGADLPGDVVLSVVCAEETLSDEGAGYLVEQHASLFDGIRYAIGEGGGFSLQVGGKQLYPIQVAEKQQCWLRATLRGPGGHGSAPVRGGAMAQLAHLVRQLDRRRLPVHIVPAARMMFSAWAEAVGGVTGALLGQLVNPLLTNGILNLMGERGRIFDPLLHNTVSPTVVQASEQVNVIPSRVTVDLDGRLLPGYGPEDLIAELRRLVGRDIEIEVVNCMSGPAKPDMGLYGLLSETLRRADPGGTPVPFFLSATTDARLFSQLGIQSYGYVPCPLPPDVNIAELVHGVDERIPVESVAFGTNVLYELLRTYSITS